MKFLIFYILSFPLMAEGRLENVAQIVEAQYKVEDRLESLYSELVESDDFEFGENIEREMQQLISDNGGVDLQDEGVIEYDKMFDDYIPKSIDYIQELYLSKSEQVQNNLAIDFRCVERTNLFEEIKNEDGKLLPMTNLFIISHFKNNCLETFTKLRILSQISMDLKLSFSEGLNILSLFLKNKN